MIHILMLVIFGWGKWTRILLAWLDKVTWLKHPKIQKNILLKMIYHSKQYRDQ